MAFRDYTDSFREDALLILEASGYPDKKGAVDKAAKATGVSVRTLRRWWVERDQARVPANVASEKRNDLREMIESELAGIFGDMPGARYDANYRELATAAGILIDKLQIITGNPTEITQNKKSQIVITIPDNGRD